MGNPTGANPPTPVFSPEVQAAVQTITDATAAIMSTPGVPDFGQFNPTDVNRLLAALAVAASRTWELWGNDLMGEVRHQGGLMGTLHNVIPQVMQLQQNQAETNNILQRTQGELVNTRLGIDAVNSDLQKASGRFDQLEQSAAGINNQLQLASGTLDSTNQSVIMAQKQLVDTQAEISRLQLAVAGLQHDTGGGRDGKGKGKSGYDRTRKGVLEYKAVSNLREFVDQQG